MGEFELIKGYFAKAPTTTDVVLGIGDDCAITCLPFEHEMLVSVDTLVSGTHFFEGAPAYDIATRALNSALSDLAAMGADARWFTLALTLPLADEAWVKQFSEGLLKAAGVSQCTLIGGDTTRGPLTISIQVHGSLPKGSAIRRDGAQVGDAIYVTHTLGDGAAALASLSGTTVFTDEAQAYLYQRFYNPMPRLAEGQQLRGIASSAIDISDGLSADLQHICDVSEVGACVNLDDLPVSRQWRSEVSGEQALRWALFGGDDYELCFTVPPQYNAALDTMIAEGAMVATKIGDITAEPGLVLQSRHQSLQPSECHGYTHFA